MASLVARAKNTLITLPQVHAPGLVGAAVRALTSGPRGSDRGSAEQAVLPGDAPRYAPEGDGRVNGIRAAQAAAAPLPRAPRAVRGGA